MERFEPKKFISVKIKDFRALVGDRKAIVAVSGGIDSLLCFEIAWLAVKDQKNQLIPFMLDTGLLRENEVKEIQEYFQKKYAVELQKWDRQNEFFSALKGVVSPEQKRAIFRDVFYRTMSQAIRSYDANLLVQGTILPDIIETQKGIKAHFNVLNEAGINPLNYGLRIFEPLKELTKTRVKMAARSLAIPPRYLRRQPFPGPGFAIRITGEVTFERVEKLKKATTIVESEFNNPKIFQAFPVLLADRVTGIKNDTSIIGDIIAIRIVEITKDSLLAKPYKVPWKKLEKLAKRILNEIPGVVRVLYDVTPKPPGTIEFA